MLCKRRSTRYVFPGSLLQIPPSRHRCFRNRCRCAGASETHSLTGTQSVGEPHDAIFTVFTRTVTRITVKFVTRSPCIDPADPSINISEIASHSVKPPNAKLFTPWMTVMTAHVLRGEKCPDASRMFALKYRVRRDLNTDVTVLD